MSARKAVLAVTASLALLFALWPFDFRLPAFSVQNGARVTSGGELAFDAPGIVVDEGAAAPLHRGLHGREAVTVAVAAESFSAAQDGPARLVSFARDPWQANFTLGQSGDGIVFRLRTPATGELGWVPGLIADGVVEPGQRQLFVATYDGQRFRIYADGRLAGERELAAGRLEGWDPGFQLSFGNEATGNRPWRGRISDVVVFDEALDAAGVASLKPESLSAPRTSPIYRLRERCRGGDVHDVAPGELAGSPPAPCKVPARLRVTERFELLSLKPRWLSDVVENALVWGTVGLVVGTCFRSRRPLAIVVPLLAVAMALEAAQVLLASRSSSLADLATAVLAGTLAVAGARRAARHRGRDRREVSARPSSNEPSPRGRALRIRRGRPGADAAPAPRAPRSALPPPRRHAARAATAPRSLRSRRRSGADRRRASGCSPAACAGPP